MKNKIKERLIQSQKRIRTKTDFHLEEADYPPHALKKVAVLEKSFDTYHADMKDLFHEPFNPAADQYDEINMFNLGDNIHGTAVASIIKQLYPGKLMPVIFSSHDIPNSVKSLDYASENADIINISQTLSQGYIYKSIEESVKSKLDQIFSSNKLFILAAGNAFQNYASTPYFQDLSNLAIDKKNVIFVGATVDDKGVEKLWRDGSLIKHKIDEMYEFEIGSSYPGKLANNQSHFLFAPSKNYTALSNEVIPNDAYEYFSMTSSSAPVVTAIAANLWSQFPEKSATEIGSALLEGGSFKYLDKESKQLYGQGMVNYSNSLKILQSQDIMQK